MLTTSVFCESGRPENKAFFAPLTRKTLNSVHLSAPQVLSRNSLQHPPETIAYPAISRYHTGASYPRQGLAGTTPGVLAHPHDEGNRGR